MLQCHYSGHRSYVPTDIYTHRFYTPDFICSQSESNNVHKETVEFVPLLCGKDKVKSQTTESRGPDKDVAPPGRGGQVLPLPSLPYTQHVTRAEQLKEHVLLNLLVKSKYRF